MLDLNGLDSPKPKWEDPLKEVMTTHSSILAWWIPWTEEPGGLQSVESQRVGHDWAASTFTFNRKWNDLYSVSTTEGWNEHVFQRKYSTLWNYATWKTSMRGGCRHSKQIDIVKVIHSKSSLFTSWYPFIVSERSKVTELVCGLSLCNFCMWTSVCLLY